MRPTKVGASTFALSIDSYAIREGAHAMTAADRSIAEYQDIAGDFLRSNNWLQRTRIPGSWEAAVQAATNANLAFLTSGQPFVGSTTPAAAQYQSVQDILLLTYQTVPGSYVQVTVPAPLGSMFLSGGVVPDPANATYIALQAAIVANVTDVAGNAALSLVSAVKSSRRRDQFSG